ncbi:lysylphosphatidylglycerol synthase transmembrane domain-containing protein [Meridianimarinicoccus aquatilis]|uniref:Flippase-like domain-containing protein n=1 Tax=Meridianimarinicoccus aquatilis TaxID=2552766 RepID=A0A4R6B4V6_9RHOB|nr:lysylphosphatidylglycerol synthase transmembrane domain-containing protein [Fluviibacterium aquatile]QIE43734.1 flippase-like domain-containing protein [Rhodobacteraceae bacterium SC52]TDL90396.1 flippase-like domain-containing protein [Fluviibacterium aquatile]
MKLPAKLREWRPGKGTVRLLSTFGLVVLLGFVVDLRAAVSLLWAADGTWLLAGYAALTLQTVISAARWRLMAERLDHRFSLLRAVREYYLAQFLNQTLPGGMVGDAGRALRAREGAGLVRAGQAVLFERMSGQIALIVLAAPGLAVSAILPGGVRWPAALGTVALAVAAFLVLMPLLVLGGSRAPGAVGRASRDFLGAAKHAVFAREVRLTQIVLSFGTALSTLAAFSFCAAATGTGLNAFSVVTVVPLILLAMIIPLSVAGWGLRESAAALLFPVIGASAEAGVAASVAFGLVFLAVTLPGAAVLLWDMQVRRGSAD